MKENKQHEAWKVFVSDLSEAARKYLNHTEPTILPIEAAPQRDDESADGYHQFRKELSPAAREWLDAQVDTVLRPEDEIDASVARYCVVEGPDGGWPTARLFKTPEALARRISQLDGTDMVIWCFFGIPIHLTRGPQRYLLLPGGQDAIMIPLIEGGPCKIVPADLLENLELQDDGFLGPPELANTEMIEAKLEPAKAEEEEEEDDDEEDLGEQGVD